MTKELQYVRKQIIPKLLKHPLALPFKYPVDAITEGIYPDYFMVSVFFIVLIAQLLFNWGLSVRLSKSSHTK